jgi:acyl-CoA reductase-like NAD-dependent aldehyde dehydrogenase
VTTTDVNATVVSVVGTTAANTLTLSTANSFTLRAALTTTSPAAAFGLADRFVAATVLVNAPTWQSNASTGWAAVTGAFK